MSDNTHVLIIYPLQYASTKSICQKCGQCLQIEPTQAATKITVTYLHLRDVSGAKFKEYYSEVWVRYFEAYQTEDCYLEKCKNSLTQASLLSALF